MSGCSKTSWILSASCPNVYLVDNEYSVLRVSYVYLVIMNI